MNEQRVLNPYLIGEDERAIQYRDGLDGRLQFLLRFTTKSEQEDIIKRKLQTFFLSNIKRIPDAHIICRKSHNTA